MRENFGDRYGLSIGSTSHPPPLSLAARRCRRGPQHGPRDSRYLTRFFTRKEGFSKWGSAQESKNLPVTFGTVAPLTEGLNSIRWVISAAESATLSE